MIYSIFPALLVSRCSPFDLATGNDFLKWLLMVFDIIYSTLEQSCNVLNYTKLSELVANKEHHKGCCIAGISLPVTAYSPFFLKKKGQRLSISVISGYIVKNN